MLLTLRISAMGFSVIPVPLREVPGRTDDPHDQRVDREIGNTEEDLVIVPGKLKQEAAVAEQNQHQGVVFAGDFKFVLLFFQPDEEDDRHGDQCLNRLDREGLVFQNVIVNAILPRVAVATAAEHTAEVADAVLHAYDGRQVIAHGTEVQLEPFAKRVCDHRHPDEDADDVVAAEVFKAALGPIEKEHPSQSERINDDDKGYGLL